MAQISIRDYSLVGQDSAHAVERGLAGAAWYTSPVPKDQMRELLQRRDGPALRDTALWFALLIVSGICGYLLWGTWWAIIPFLLYGVIYGSTSDSRWHESLHGTAFKTDWMNNVLYEIASFMVMRESTPWRWSHTRHHSDTIIVGRDPEIAVPRPPDITGIVLSFFDLNVMPRYLRKLMLHSTGKLTAEERTYIPADEFHKVFVKARIVVLIYALVIALVIYTRSILPLMYIGLPNIYGSWLMPIYGLTQHAGLAEDVLDHRLNCRTVYMNPLHRYLYWNMNYHVEHHMFPLVPYHALPRLHELVQADMPAPYHGIVAAFREIIPTIRRQIKDPGYYVKRKLPTPTRPEAAPVAVPIITAANPVAVNGWVEVGSVELLRREDVLRFDHAGQTYAIYRTADDRYFATDGICTHGNTHLAGGMVKGNLIECAKHNGRFDITDGSPRRAPACVALKTYQVRITNGNLLLDITSAGGCGLANRQTTYSFKVIRNDNVATYIKELVLEPEASSPQLHYQPGDYLQFNIPAYGNIHFGTMAVQEPYAATWKAQHVFDLRAQCASPVRRNYSLAGNPALDQQYRLNVRIATPPRGQDCPAGTGSAYMFSLKPGDRITAVGPFGQFHIKNTQQEMVYLGGGSGMAPLRSHLSHLFDTLHTSRKVSFWYGARSLRELFYQDYFNALAARCPNFSFHVALSEPQPSDQWTGPTGLVHEVFRRQYLNGHGNPAETEFYLCGPPLMIQASLQMLEAAGVQAAQISYDEFS